MGQSDIKDMMRKVFQELFDKKDIAALDRYCTADFVDHNPPDGGKGGNINEAKKSFQAFFRGLPDAQAKISEMIAEGDRIYVRATFSGTHRGEFMGLSPSGKRVSYEVWHTFRLSDGKIAEHWALIDPLALMRQIGLSPKQIGDAMQASTH